MHLQLPWYCSCLWVALITCHQVTHPFVCSFFYKKKPIKLDKTILNISTAITRSFKALPGKNRHKGQRRAAVGAVSSFVGRHANPLNHKATVYAAHKYQAKWIPNWLLTLTVQLEELWNVFNWTAAICNGQIKKSSVICHFRSFLFSNIVRIFQYGRKLNTTWYYTKIHSYDWLYCTSAHYCEALFTVRVVSVFTFSFQWSW